MPLCSNAASIYVLYDNDNNNFCIGTFVQELFVQGHFVLGHFIRGLFVQGHFVRVPLRTVSSTLLSYFGEVHERMLEPLSYFEHRCKSVDIDGWTKRKQPSPSLLPIQRWNQHQVAVDGITRKTNSVEGWRYSLQSMLQCHHPTLCTFMDGLLKDIQKQKASFLQGIQGVYQPPKKKYHHLKNRVGRAVSLYINNFI